MGANRPVSATCVANSLLLPSSPAILRSVMGFSALNERVLWGWFFLMIGSFSFVGFLYAAVVSKLQPPSHNAIIRAIQDDWYYCFLVPLALPVLVVAVYLHWLSMTLFKHA